MIFDFKYLYPKVKVENSWWLYLYYEVPCISKIMITWPTLLKMLIIIYNISNICNSSDRQE